MPVRRYGLGSLIAAGLGIFITAIGSSYLDAFCATDHSSELLPLQDSTSSVVRPGEGSYLDFDEWGKSVCSFSEKMKMYSTKSPSSDSGGVESLKSTREEEYEVEGITESQPKVGDHYSQELIWVRKAATEGDAKAQFGLGFRYARGIGVTRDDVEAFKWYQRAADQGFPMAQFNLGVFYAESRGVDNDDNQAVEWYQKAADQGVPQAQFNLGVMYANGRSVEKDETKAVSLIRQAAEQGFEPAQSVLGRFYSVNYFTVD